MILLAKYLYFSQFVLKFIFKSVLSLCQGIYHILFDNMDSWHIVLCVCIACTCVRVRVSVCVIFYMFIATIIGEIKVYITRYLR